MGRGMIMTEHEKQAQALRRHDARQRVEARRAAGIPSPAERLQQFRDAVGIDRETADAIWAAKVANLRRQAGKV